MLHIPSLLDKLLNKVKPFIMEELNTDVNSGQAIPGNEAVDQPDAPNNFEGPEPVQVKKITWMKALTAIFNGLGVGLLLGMLLGLSVSPVVSGVIAAISGLLAVLLGLDEKYLDSLKSIRIGAFGFFAVCGIMIGLYIRANDAFAPSMLDKKNEYVALGYSDAEARAFITKFIETDTGKTRREAGVLYSSTVNAGACDVLVYAKEETPLSELVNTFTEAGGTWKELAETFRKDLPEELVKTSLLAMRDCFCDLASSGEIVMTNRDKVARLNQGDSLNHIEEVMSSCGKNWQAIVARISPKIDENQRKKVYLSIIKVLTHD
jgi:hypothetical protein